MIYLSLRVLDLPIRQLRHSKNSASIQYFGRHFGECELICSGNWQSFIQNKVGTMFAPSKASWQVGNTPDFRVDQLVRKRA
jgi:hypothetical protein